MKKQSKSKKIITILTLILVFAVYCYSQNNWIKVEKIKVEINNLPKELNGMKIVQVSDVHLPKNASSIENIIGKVRDQKPDIIVLTGDIIDSSADVETCGLDELSKGLSAVAKTYAVTGNHEVGSGEIGKWTSTLENNNIKVIDNKIEVAEINNKSIAIAGLSDGREYNTENFKEIEKVKGMPLLLLAHRPELFHYYYSELNSIKPNIVFSGHAHGGQFRIPFINKGVIAPNQGFFPQYTSGLYKADNNVIMVVSRGLGNSIIPIRLNNRPHLPVIEIVSQE